MTNYYEAYPKFLVSVDCIIFGFSGGSLKLLVQKRKMRPAEGELSLMGGFVKDKESLNQAAARVLTELTGLPKIYMRQLGAFGEVERDPGERVISVAFYALINVEEYNDAANAKGYDARWYDIDKIPRLCLDHNKMVDKARESLKSRLLTEPIGYNLLPRHFTLSQLQSLHESIMGTAIDKRNFRRSITEKDYVVKTDKIDHTSSKRGAMLYMYNDKKYGYQTATN